MARISDQCIPPAPPRGAASDRRPLRIAHLTASALPLTVGGMEVVVDSLIRHQIAAGHDVTLVTRWKQAQAARAAVPQRRALALPPNLIRDPAPFRDVGPRWPVAAAAAWMQLRHRFDVWHVHWIYPMGWMVEPILRRLGVPVVMTAHGADLGLDRATGFGFRQFERHDRRIRAMLPQARWITGVSAAMCAEAVALGAAPSAVHDIPNGVDAAAIAGAPCRRAEIRARLGVSDGAPLILTVGRNQPSKGLHHIPEALARLTADAPGLAPVWAIAGPRVPDLAPLFDAAGLGAQVRLLPAIRKAPGEDGAGPPAELVALYRAADLFVFPTHSEAFGLVALEALAAGTPVIASDIPGLRTVLRHEENALLVPAGDPAAIAAAAARLLNDPGLRARLIAQGLADAAALDWGQVAARFVALYRAAWRGTAG